MRSTINTILVAAALAAAALSFTSCDTAFDEINYSDGEANLTRYVAIGGGYTAGYCDSALYLDAQRYSFPSILAGRFALAEGGDFKQPLVKPGVGIGVNGNARYGFALVQDPCGSGSIVKAVPLDSAGDASNFTWLGTAVKYNNMGVPGTRTKDLHKQSFGDPSPFVGNPFYSRFATTPGISTVSGDAVAQGPTFYTLWMGMEDVFGYARKGGKESGDSITDVLSFQTDLALMINNLQAVGAKGVLANLPSPAAIPFFTAMDPKGLILTEDEADSLNTIYNNIGCPMNFQAGANYYVISDTTMPCNKRQLTAGEYLLLTVPVDSIRCKKMGSIDPIPARHILDAQEIALVNAAITSYNIAIQSLGQQENITVVDMFAFFNSLSTGSAFNGAGYSSAYPAGGFYSTDGFYPTPRGYAMIANRFIESINTAFKARLPFADVNAYPGVRFP